VDGSRRPGTGGPGPTAVAERVRGIAGDPALRMFDGLIAASALEAECDTLYSEELQDGQVLEGRLTVRNPFVQ
jgi:predicted nucleic acid-binding protein